MFYAKESSYLSYPAVAACIVLIFAIVSTPVAAQQRKLISGSLDGLKAQKSYDIQFTYDSLHVGDYVAEDVYLSQKRKDWELKEPGKGIAFVDQWFADRKKRYQPTFIKSFESYSRRKLNDKNAKYTLVLKTKYTEGGWSAGVVSHSANIGGELWIVESADQNKVIAKISFFGLAGKPSSSGRDFDMTWRIQSAYDFAGKVLGDFLKKKVR